MPHKCPIARAAWRAAWFERNREKQLARIKAWKVANRDAVRRSSAGEMARLKARSPEAYAERVRRREAYRTPKQRAAKWKKWAAKNGERMRAYRIAHLAEHASRQRPRSSRLGKPPAWADIDAIKAVYRESQRLTIETGIEHHVDHVIPLLGKTVSGLHVHENLQILTADANRRKSNKLMEALL